MDYEIKSANRQIYHEWILIKKRLEANCVTNQD